MKRNITNLLLGIFSLSLLGCGSNVSSSMGSSIVAPSTNGSGTGDTTWSSVLLTDITLSDGALSPAFSKETVAYTAQVANATSSITITPTTEDPYAQVTIEGQVLSSGQTSNPIALVANVPRTINIMVASGKVGEEKIYSLTVTREPSNDANLSALVVNSATISPAFHKSTIIYSAIVPFTTTLVSVIPTLEDLTATLSINGSSINSGDNFTVNLTPGYNIVNIIVTAQNSIDSKTYTIVITRGNSNADLLSLQVFNQAEEEQGLTPTFDKDITNYIVQLDSSTNALRITPGAPDIYTEVKVNDVVVNYGYQSRNIDVVNGINIVTIHVTSSDTSTQRTYTILAVKP